MAKYDPESNSTTKLAASARLFTALQEAHAVAGAIPAGSNNQKLGENLSLAENVALYRLGQQLEEFLADPEVKSDSDAIIKAAKEMNASRAAGARPVTDATRAAHPDIYGKPKVQAGS